MAFKLAWALCQQASGAKKVSPRMRDFLVQAVGLAALGTVADVVPLVDENRVLVHHGLESLARCPTLGLATLMRVAKVEPKADGDGSRGWIAKTSASRSAPRLNAAGRLGQPQLAVELLVTDRPERALELAQYIDQLNATRQTLERSIQLGRQQADQGAIRPGRRCRLRAGRAGLASGRDRHRRRPAGRKASSARGADLLGPAGRAAGHRLGAERPRLQPARGPGKTATSTCWPTAVMPRRPGLKIEEAKLDAFRAAFCEVAAAEIHQDQRVADLRIDAEAPSSAFTLAGRPRTSSGWPLSASTTPGPCSAPPGPRWSARPNRWAAADGIWP